MKHYLYKSDLVIHLTKMTGDLDISWNLKIIEHQAGLGYKVQGSRFKVKCLAFFAQLRYCSSVGCLLYLCV